MEVIIKANSFKPNTNSKSVLLFNLWNNEGVLVHVSNVPHTEPEFNYKKFKKRSSYAVGVWKIKTLKCVAHKK